MAGHAHDCVAWSAPSCTLSLAYLARFGPTTPTRAGRLSDATVDHTDARKTLLPPHHVVPRIQPSSLTQRPRTSADIPAGCPENRPSVPAPSKSPGSVLLASFVNAGATSAHLLPTAVDPERPRRRGAGRGPDPLVATDLSRGRISERAPRYSAATPVSIRIGAPGSPERRGRGREGRLDFVLRACERIDSG
jgi:hypothetical protein